VEHHATELLEKLELGDVEKGITKENLLKSIRKNPKLLSDLSSGVLHHTQQRVKFMIHSGKDLNVILRTRSTPYCRTVLVDAKGKEISVRMRSIQVGMDF
jgi:hypothetical protein